MDRVAPPDPPSPDPVLRTVIVDDHELLAHSAAYALRAHGIDAQVVEVSTIDGIAQVNLGVRTHRNRPLSELGAMSRQVIATLEEACEYTARMIADIRASEEGQEGMNAFLEKRKPNWVKE